MPQVTLLTPTYEFDIERCALMLRCADVLQVDLAHVVIAHTEDVKAAEQAARGLDRDVTVIATADVLPVEIEKLRRGIRRRHPAHWVRRGLGRPTHLAGWYVQQLTKLAWVACSPENTVVAVDSDVLPTDRWSVNDFVRDGRSVRFESVDQDAEMAAWGIQAMDFLGIPRQRTPMLRHTHCPAVFDANVTRDLLRHIEERHAMEWYRALAKGNVFEYSVYGAYATHLDAMARTRAVPPMPGRLVSFADQFPPPDEPIAKADYRYVSVQSRLSQPVAVSETLWQAYARLG